MSIGFRALFGGSEGDPEPLWTDGRCGRRLSAEAVGNVLYRARRLAGVDIGRAGFGVLRKRYRPGEASAVYANT